MCLTPKFSSNATPITTPPLLIIAFARWVKIPPEVLSWRIFSSLLYAATAENSAVPFLNCFIGQALMHAPQPMHADSSTFAYTNPSLSGFILIALTGHLSAHAEQPQQSCLSYSFICFSWAGKIP